MKGLGAVSNFDSPFYPYEKVYAYNGLKGAENIPYKILVYLLDLPLSDGYVPVDDNARPRVRLAKYLWYDEPNPLSQALPTPAQKLSLLFDGEHPVIDTDDLKAAHPKGYRMYWQVFFGQSQTEAKTTLKCYMGRSYSPDGFHTRLGVTFEVLCNVNLETNTKTAAYARAYDIEQCIIEALNGVNMAGVGTFELSRGHHGDNGSRPISDSGTNVGRELKMSLEWAEGNSETITQW